MRWLLWAGKCDGWIDDIHDYECPNAPVFEGIDWEEHRLLCRECAERFVADDLKLFGETSARVAPLAELLSETALRSP